MGWHQGGFVCCAWAPSRGPESSRASDGTLAGASLETVQGDLPLARELVQDGVRAQAQASDLRMLSTQVSKCSLAQCRAGGGGAEGQRGRLRSDRCRAKPRAVMAATLSGKVIGYWLTYTTGLDRTPHESFPAETQVKRLVSRTATMVSLSPSRGCICEARTYPDGAPPGAGWEAGFCLQMPHHFLQPIRHLKPWQGSGAGQLRGGQHLAA